MGLPFALSRPRWGRHEEGPQATLRWPDRSPAATGAAQFQGNDTAVRASSYERTHGATARNSAQQRTIRLGCSNLLTPGAVRRAVEAAGDLVDVPLAESARTDPIVNLNLPPELGEALERACAEQGVSLRCAVTGLLEKTEVNE